MWCIKHWKIRGLFLCIVESSCYTNALTSSAAENEVQKSALFFPPFFSSCAYVCACVEMFFSELWKIGPCENSEAFLYCAFGSEAVESICESNGKNEPIIRYLQESGKFQRKSQATANYNPRFMWISFNDRGKLREKSEKKFIINKYLREYSALIFLKFI